MILHVDMDAFYASVEERDRPELAGRPLIVGGTPAGRGVVAAANYVVRRFGVHSAMPTATALRLCPEAVVLPVRMSHYAKISRQIREILFRYTPLVEPLSLDEAFLDVTGCGALFGIPQSAPTVAPLRAQSHGAAQNQEKPERNAVIAAERIARRIKDEIRDETGLVASVGVAPNKFLAKIASDLEKPDGLVVVSAEEIAAFLDPLPVGRLWGVGKVTGGTLQRLGVQTIGQLRRLPAETLRRQFGSQGDHFWKLAHGEDQRPVVPDREAKSLSNETTFAADIFSLDALRSQLLELLDQLMQRLRAQQHRARTIHIKIRFADFRTITRSRTLPHSTDVTQEIGLAATAMLAEALPMEPPGVRLLGVGVSGLSASGSSASEGSGNGGSGHGRESGALVQQMLFDQEDPQRAKQRQLDRVADAVRAKFGSTALGRGSGVARSADRSSGASLRPSDGGI